MLAGGLHGYVGYIDDRVVTRYAAGSIRVLEAAGWVNTKVLTWGHAPVPTFFADFVVVVAL